MKFKISKVACGGAAVSALALGLTANAKVKIADPSVMMVDPVPTNMLHVVDTVDPVRFEGMQTLPAGSTGNFLFDTGDGVVKKSSVKVPELVFYAQSAIQQDYNQPAFGSSSLTLSNHDILKWEPSPPPNGDVVIENTAYIDLEATTAVDDEDTFTVNLDGTYKMTGHANYYLSDGLIMDDESHIAVVVYKLEPGSTTWVASVGNRCAYSSQWEKLTSSCVYNGVDKLVAGTKLRVHIFRGNGYKFTAPHAAQILSSSRTGNGITTTRTFEVTYYPE